MTTQDEMTIESSHPRSQTYTRPGQTARILRKATIVSVAAAATLVAMAPGARAEVSPAGTITASVATASPAGGLTTPTVLPPHPGPTPVPVPDPCGPNGCIGVVLTDCLDEINLCDEPTPPADPLIPDLELCLQATVELCEEENEIDSIVTVPPAPDEDDEDDEDDEPEVPTEDEPEVPTEDEPEVPTEDEPEVPAEDEPGVPEDEDEGFDFDAFDAPRPGNPNFAG